MLTVAGYQIDDDPQRVDVEAVWRYLSEEAYWARWRTRAEVADQISQAWRVVGCYDARGAQVGFARAVSDGSNIAYLADVYVLDSHRGQGLARAVVTEMIENGPGRSFRWMLHTKNAHDLYREFGFHEPDERFMERTSTREAM